MILALINNKGGVGKTTTAVNLAAALSDRGRVLLVDLDSQGSASLALGVPRDELLPSMSEVLIENRPLEETIRSTTVHNLDLVTGSMGLASADLAIAHRKGRERLLKEALAPIRNAYDFVVVDCPPSLSLLPINALTAADAFIVPIAPQYLALEGLVNLFGAVDQVRTGIGECADLLGIVITMADYRLRVTQEIVSLIRRHYGAQVFKTEIRGNVRLAEAPSFGQTIFQYDGSSAGADAYYRLAMEVRKRVGALER